MEICTSFDKYPLFGQLRPDAIILVVDKDDYKSALKTEKQKFDRIITSATCTLY